MTATLYRLYRDMPQELCVVEAREAIAYYASEMRIQVAHDRLIDVQQMRAQWSANRKAQEAAKVGVYQPLPRFGFAQKLACIAGLIAGLAIGHVAVAAMTSHIAHQMEDFQ